MSSLLRICLALLVAQPHLSLAAPSLGGTPENPFCSPFDTDPDYSDETWTSSYSSDSDSDSSQSKSKAPGLGIEFESGAITFSTVPNPQCKKSGYFDRKGRPISNAIAKDKTWMFTGDTTANIFDEHEGVGHLSGEFIMNGRKVKLGQNQAGAAAQGMLDYWNEAKYWETPKRIVTILGPKKNPSPECDKWEVGPKIPQDPEWLTQVTTSMSLAAIDKLFQLSTKRASHELVTFAHSVVNSMVWASEEFFQDSPGGLDGKDPAVRGFFSLLLTYAKNAHKSNANASPKMLSSIMPRTNFVAMYSLIEDKMKGADLYDVTKQLACWRMDRENDYEVWLDDKVGDGLRWCDQTTKAPTDRMDKQAFKIEGKTVMVREWIKNIAAGRDDLLQIGDREIDGQIGALGKRMEWLFNTKVEAPIFEFRDLKSVRTSQFKSRVETLEQAVLKLHAEFNS